MSLHSYTMWCAVLFSTFVLAAKCAERTIDNSCPTSLLKTEDKFYLQVDGNTCYRFVTYNRKTYDEAKDICKKDGGTLVMPKTKKLNFYIARELKYTYNKTEPTWIGLNDRKDEGSFKWEDGSKLEWENFAEENGPDNRGFLGLRGKAEDCVAIHSDRLWHDYQCKEDFLSFISNSDVMKNFVCQYPALNLPENKGSETDSKDGHREKNDEYGDLLGNKAGQDTLAVDDNIKENGTSGEDDDIKKEIYDNNREGLEENVDESDTNQDYDEDVEKLGNTTTVQGGGGCPPFNCDKFCDMLGFQTDSFGCLLCECVSEM